MAARRAAPQKPPKAAPPIPETREPGPPRSRHSPRDCPGAHATTERHTRRAARRVRSSPPASRAESDPQRDSPRTRQRRQLHYLRPQQRPYIILQNTGKNSPQYSLETHFRPDGQTERAPREIAAPAGWDTAAQHWTAYAWMRQHLRGIRSAPKAVLAHAAPARGHCPCIKAGATKRVLLTPGILSALLHQMGNAQRLQRGTSSRQAQLQANSPL